MLGICVGSGCFFVDCHCVATLSLSPGVINYEVTGTAKPNSYGLEPVLYSNATRRVWAGHVGYLWQNLKESG